MTPPLPVPLGKGAFHDCRDGETFPGGEPRPLSLGRLAFSSFRSGSGLGKALGILPRAPLGDRYVVSISHDKRTAYKWIKLPFPGLFLGLLIK